MLTLMVAGVWVSTYERFQSHGPPYPSRSDFRLSASFALLTGGPGQSRPLGLILDLRHQHAIASDDASEELLRLLKSGCHALGTACGHRLRCGDAEAILVRHNTR